MKAFTISKKVMDEHGRWDVEYYAKLIEKGKKSESDANEMVTGTLGRIAGTLDKSELADCDIVIEAIVENLDAKKALFGELGRICKSEAIFASNTPNPVTVIRYQSSSLQCRSAYVSNPGSTAAVSRVSFCS